MKPYLIFKAILDYLLAGLLFGLTAPVMLVAVLALKLDSRGPILFRQERPGKDGKIFTIYKLRSMRVETQQVGRPLSDMERMTRVGAVLRKLSIDELPQLINILRGEMSFIGPRPLLVKYLERYTPEQMRRHEVKPGITGWAQVNGRNAISWEDKFRYDVWYVDHVSFWVDLKICLLTLAKIASVRGVNQSQGQTMDEFGGPPKEETGI